MYEKGNVSIRKEKKIPRMLHSPSHFVILLQLLLAVSKLSVSANACTAVPEYPGTISVPYTSNTGIC